MKKRILLAAGAVLVTAAVSVFVYVKNWNNSMDKLFNVKALAEGEGGAGCTGPQKENLAGNIFWDCENTVQCRDMYNCN